MEAPKQEVARATRGIDHRGLRQTEGLDGWGERPVQDELLDKNRGLEQRVGALGVVRQVLVEISEEPGVPI